MSLGHPFFLLKKKNLRHSRYVTVTTRKCGGVFAISSPLPRRTEGFKLLQVTLVVLCAQSNCTLPATLPCINPHPSLPSPPSHTHTHTNSIPLDSWSISRDNTTPLVSLCLHRDTLTPHRAPCTFTGMHPQKNPQSKFLLNLSTPPQVLCFMLHILQETARLSVCARHVRGSILRNCCRLVPHLCRIVSLRQ